MRNTVARFVKLLAAFRMGRSSERALGWGAHMAGDGKETLYYNRQGGHRVVAKEDGGLIATGRNQSFETGPDGVVGHLPALEAINVKDIAKLKKHEIINEDGAMSHELEFLDGSTVAIKFNAEGRLLSFASKSQNNNLTVSVDTEGRELTVAFRQNEQE